MAADDILRYTIINNDELTARSKCNEKAVSTSQAMLEEDKEFVKAYTQNERFRSLLHALLFEEMQRRFNPTMRGI